MLAKNNSRSVCNEFEADFKTRDKMVASVPDSKKTTFSYGNTGYKIAEKSLKNYLHSYFQNVLEVLFQHEQSVTTSISLSIRLNSVVKETQGTKMQKRKDKILLS